MTDSASTANIASPAKSSALSPFTRRVALIVSGTFFIEQLDTTIIATAIPEIAHALGTEPLRLNLAMTAYMVGLAAIVPISGRIADRYGTRTVFAGATALFIVASLLCGLATSDTYLIASRFLQGIGGAMMAPVGRLIVMRTASRSELVEAMALVMVPAMVAKLVGPAAGGVIVTWFSWRWIFLINVPIGLIAIALILRLVPQERIATVRSFDPVGSLLVGACFVSAALACEGLAGSGVGLSGSAVLWVISACCLGVYIRHSRRHPAPVIDLGLLKLPNFRHAMLGGSIYRIAVGGVPFLLPVSLQLAHGVSALASGFILLLPAFGGLVMKFFSTALLRWHGYRPSFLLHGALSALFLAMLAISGKSWSWWAIGAILIAFGFSRSLLMNAYGTIAYAEVTREHMAAATSFFLAIQNLTTGLGVAFAALSARLAQLLLPEAGAETQFAIAFGALAICAAVSVALSLLFESSAGADLVRHPSRTPAAAQRPTPKPEISR